MYSLSRHIPDNENLKIVKNRPFYYIWQHYTSSENSLMCVRISVSISGKYWTGLDISDNENPLYKSFRHHFTILLK